MPVSGELRQASIADDQFCHLPVPLPFRRCELTKFCCVYEPGAGSCLNASRRATRWDATNPIRTRAAATETTATPTQRRAPTGRRSLRETNEEAKPVAIAIAAV